MVRAKTSNAQPLTTKVQYQTTLLSPITLDMPTKIVGMSSEDKQTLSIVTRQ
jgi:hypothetical protein